MSAVEKLRPARPARRQRTSVRKATSTPGQRPSSAEQWTVLRASGTNRSLQRLSNGRRVPQQRNRRPTTPAKRSTVFRSSGPFGVRVPQCKSTESTRVYRHIPVRSAGRQFFSVLGERSDAYRVSASDDRRRNEENWPRPEGLRRKSCHTSFSPLTVDPPQPAGSASSARIFTRNAARRYMSIHPRPKVHELRRTYRSQVGALPGAALPAKESAPLHSGTRKLSLECASGPCALRCWRRSVS